MSIEHHYQSATTAAVAFDEILDSVRLGDEGFVEDGQLGEVGMAGLFIDDVDGTAGILPWQRYYALETACPSAATLTGTVAKSTSSVTITGTGTAFLAELSPGDEVAIPGGGGTDYRFVASVADNTHADLYQVPAHSATGQTVTRAAAQRLFSGWTGDGGEDRGASRPGGGFSIGPGRVIDRDLAEGNTLLHFRILRSIGARPQETLGARLAVILALSEVSALIHDDGLVDYPTDVTLDATTATELSNQYLDEVLHSMAQACGRNFSVDYHEATGHWQLIFKLPSAFFMPSPLRISNFAADDGVAGIYRPSDDAGGRRSEVVGGIMAGIQVVGARLSRYRTNAALADLYEYRDINTSDLTLKSSAAINAYGDRQLVDGASPDERVTVTIVVPKAEVWKVRRLREIEVRLQHLTGWTSWTWARIVRIEKHHAIADNGEAVPDFYECALTLDAPTGAVPTPPTASYAEIVYPQAVGGSGATGPVLLNWSNTGDSPKSPRIAHPLVGLMAYDATGVDAAFPTDKTGIKFNGSGTVAIHCQAGFEMSWLSGSHPVTLNVYVGATVVGSAVIADPSSGIHVVAGYVSVDLTGVAVSNGDILTAQLAWSGGAHDAAIPIAGTNGSTYMSAQGALS